MKRVVEGVIILSFGFILGCMGSAGIDKANTTLDAQLQEFRQLNRNFVESQKLITNQMGQMTATIQKGSESLQTLSSSLEGNSKQVTTFLEQAGKWSQVLAQMDPKNFEDILGEARGFMVAMNQAMPKLTMVLEKSGTSWLSKIGELADAAKVGSDMLRYYNLLPERQKPEVENETTDLLSQTTNAAGILQKETDQRLKSADSILKDSSENGIPIPPIVVELFKEFKETNERLKSFEKMGKETLQMAKMSPDELKKNYPGIQFMTEQLQDSKVIVSKIDAAAAKLKNSPMRSFFATLLGVAAN